jgi:phosphoglycerate dehydrogenase-like enzyme
VPASRQPGVLILTPDAPAYLPLLQDLIDAGVRIRAARTAGEAVAVDGGESVLVARPDLGAAVLERLPAIRWVQSTWAGVTPFLKLGRRDFLLTNLKEVFGAQMAEYTFGHLLAIEQRIAERASRQRQRDWWETLSRPLEGKTMGILGTGSIGTHLASVARAFRLRVTGLSRSGAPGEGFERVYPVGELRRFLAEPDYVVGVLPDTPATTRLLDAAAFQAMKRSAILVNIGRGNLVDETALAAALRDGLIAGAVLDVFAEEPLPKDSPLWDAPGAVITAHIAAKSRPADVAAAFRENYRRYCAGEPLLARVDFDLGY